MSDLVGAAQHPRTFPWSRNPDGAHTLEQALAIARQHGVIIPEDIGFAEAPPGYLADDTDALYFRCGESKPGDVVRWTAFYNALTKKVPVLVKKSVFESDEAIVVVLGHELHELNQLRALFQANGGWMFVERLYDLISPGQPGNLHDEAWSVADQLVHAMRKRP